MPVMKNALSIALVLLCGGWLLAGCSSSQDASGGSSAPAAAQAPSNDAAQKLDTYRQLLRIHNDEMAVTMGHDILDHYPQSAAASEVQQTLPAIEKRWKENSDKARLANLWLYQVSPMEGGTQSTATIYSSQPSGDDRVRLVLRRHTAWGQNVFLYGSGHGFVCRGNCTVATTFDGIHAGIKAFAPSTGEPALMIRDDKAFIAKLQHAKKITMQVTTVDAEKKETLVYEVGGFDPAKWQSVHGKKK
jgi:hypothetical protein